MKPIEVNEDNFDSLLAYDDLFLDYFNAFLQYPAFPQPLYYNRLTGSFQEVEDDSPYGAVHSSGGGDHRRRYYGPGDAERERIMDWARRERLPLFLRTKLFLEYKLCKLLIRPLEERRSTSRPSSRGLRGYSRETASYSSTSMSLAQSHEASAYENDSDFSWPGDADRLFLFKHMRPGSRCISMPPMLGLTVNGALWSPIDAYHARKLSPSKKSSRESRRATGKSRSSREKPSPGQETETGAGGDAGSKVALPSVSREDTQLTVKSRDGQKSRKSALKTESSKENTPKKRATIQTPNRGDSGRIPLTEQTNERPGPDGAELQRTLSKENAEDGDDEDEGETGSEDEIYSNQGEQEEEEVEEEDDEDGSSIALPQEVIDEEQVLVNVGELKEDVLVDQELRVEGDGEAEPDHSMINYEEDLTAVDERTESELREVEVKHRVTFHQLKEEILGSLVGMELFKAFLAGTLGEDMLNFWLDCEMYRDNVQSMEGGTDIKRTRLFRDIQDKYRFKLTPDAQKQIKQAQGNIGLSESVFTRTQYDVLRRLRSYWVARFLIHQERTGEYSYERLRERHQRMMEDAKKPMDTFLPSISLVNSLPVRPSSCFRLATTQKDWSIVAHGGRQMEEYIRPGHLMTMDDTKYIPRPMSARFHVGLACDKDAGRPFQRYLERHSDRLLLANLLFWQDVSDYVLAEDRSADRLLLMGQAWSIFNKYIMDDGIWNIDLPPGERDFIHSTLLLTSDFAEAATFDRAKEHAVHMLQREWLHFLKEDLKVFLDCRARPEDRILSASSQRSSYSERSAVARQESLMEKLDPEEAAAAAAMKKKKNKKGGKAGKDDGTNQADKEALKKQREAKKKKQIAMQRKLVRQAKARQQEAKKGTKQGVKFEGKDEKDQGKPGDGKGDKKPEDEKEATFKKMFKNKSVMNLFKTYVQDFESKDVNNMVQMYSDVDICWRIPENHADKRTSISKQIYSNFFDPNSKRSIPMSRDVAARQNTEGDRLSTKTMDMATKSVLPQIEEAFQNFWASYMDSGEEPGGERAEGGTATSRTESTQSMVLAYKRRRRGKGPQSGQQMPTAQDKNEFQTLLIKSARGIPSHKLMYFHRYLMDYNGKDGGAEFLDKDLVFYLEAQRFKEACHSRMDMALLKRKVEVILDCFVDSPLSNSGILIDISTEMSSKVMKKADIFLKDTGKDPHNPNFFDDAQYALFKEMLPYFASFSKRYQQPSYQQDRLPYSKYEKLARDRLRKFMEMEEPSTEFKLPLVNNPPQNRTGGTGMTFSIGDGLQWKKKAAVNIIKFHTLECLVFLVMGCFPVLYTLG
ncbi:uncharacterized protein LOC575237 isoform X3 [Strongylocentrotus purpuratus]|uniref:RGS domain-containing protein n=1 Tax=Strongylocentrotus purpuratus TaxID=7668 RepID=A0A7M7PQ81_STRPU|nr:uncharacterized protein LOC575237 isoform X3 [Strongylocentrotus purpuratus]